jgi:hypothetical protein
VSENSAEVTGKLGFRIRQDQRRAVNTGVNLTDREFKFVYMQGFKSCLDLMIVELNGVGQAQASAILDKFREASWP